MNTQTSFSKEVRDFADKARKGELDEQEWCVKNSVGFEGDKLCGNTEPITRIAYEVQSREDSGRHFLFEFDKETLIRALAWSSSDVCPLCESHQTREVPKREAAFTCDECQISFAKSPV